MSQSAAAAALLFSAVVVVTGAACEAGIDVPDDEGLPDPEPLPVMLWVELERAADEPIEEPFAPEPDVEPTPEPEPVPDTRAPDADCLEVRVVNTGGVTLNVRPDPSTDGTRRGQLEPNAVVDVLGVVDDGEIVNGTRVWFEIDDGALTGFISGAFAVCVDPNAPPPPAPPAGFLLPLRCDRTARVTQGNSSDFSHSGRSRYAFDFGLARGTPLTAIAAGRVVARNGATRPGDACWSGGGSECAAKANYVILQHSDGSQSVYAHLDSPSVALNAQVTRGQQIGLSGGTGYSTGPHAHVARQQNCGSTFCQTIETRFADVGVHGGIPRSGENVTSGNCP
ncbi:MAG: M23 family metallopeptidase [Deltaproteobacteria bacterium]|nr:M23 family metallopeptidase [Deltaproteobacteria bacterium]